MTNKKYIFFDIDGTILTREGKVLDSTKSALKKAQKRGHEIFINTGRCRNIIPEVLEELNFDGMVCGTGAHAEYHIKEIFKHSFSIDQINRVLQIAEEYKIPIIMSSDTECVASHEDLPVYVELFSGGKIKATDFKSLADIENSPLLKSMRPIVIDDDKSGYYDNHPGVSDVIFMNSPFTVAEFNEMVGEDINVGKASFKEPDDYSGEITLGNYTKALGIKSLLENIGADYNDAIAVGDGFNDIDMIRETPLSIAMGNSPQEIKDLADYVTDDIYEDGIFNALQHFELI